MIKICDQCGTEFNTSESKGPTKRCSDECRRTAKRAQRRAFHQRHKSDPEYAEKRRAYFVEHNRKRRTDEDYLAAERERIKKKRENDADYRAREREYSKTYNKKYLQSEKGRAVIYAGNARRRARLKEAFVEDVDRDAIFQRDGGKCGICGEAILTDVGHLHPLSFHVDHVIPLALGGEHSMANCQAAHRQCNVRKRDRADFKVG